MLLAVCSPHFSRASITRYTHAKHETILKFPRGQTARKNVQTPTETLATQASRSLNAGTVALMMSNLILLDAWFSSTLLPYNWK